MQNSSDVVKSLTILHAIRWIAQAWCRQEFIRPCKLHI